TIAELFAREGAALQVSAHEPFLLDDPEAVWYVEAGGILMFTVALQRGAPHGTRTHFLDIDAGQCLFGFDLQRTSASAGFLAVAKQGTRLRKLTVARLRELASRPAIGARIAPVLDTWIRALSMALARDLSATRTGEQPLKAGEARSIAHGIKVTSPDDVLW